MPAEPLHDGEVHLWLLPTDESRLDELAETAQGLLSPDERARLRQFRNPQSGRRFLLQRALLRRALAEHLAVDPAELAFATGSHGKPRLAYPESPEIDFSLSHSGDTAVLAVARAIHLGIDIEPHERAPAALRIANRFFAEAERQCLCGLGSGASGRALALWTLKECIVKSVGQSLWDGLAGVEVAIENGRLCWLTPPPDGDCAEWALVLAELCGTHLLALAMQCAAIRLTGLAWRLHTLGPEPLSESDLEPLATTTTTRCMPALR